MKKFGAELIAAPLRISESGERVALRVWDASASRWIGVHVRACHYAGAPPCLFAVLAAIPRPCSQREPTASRKFSSWLRATGGQEGGIGGIRGKCICPGDSRSAPFVLDMQRQRTRVGS